MSLDSQERKKKDKVEKVLKEIVAEDFPDLAKVVNLQFKKLVNIEQNKPIEIYTTILQS